MPRSMSVTSIVPGGGHAGATGLGTIIGSGFRCSARPAAHAVAQMPMIASTATRSRRNQGSLLRPGSRCASPGICDGRRGFFRFAIKSPSPEKVASVPSALSLLPRLPAAVLIALSACATAAPEAPIVAPRLPPPVVAVKPVERPTPPPEHTLWEPSAFEIERPDVPTPQLPLDEASVVRLGPDAVAWSTQSPVLKARLLSEGMCTVPLVHARPLGEYYVHLREMGIPYVITMDALFRVAHVTLSRVLADLEWRVMGPALVALLANLDARLAAEEKGVNADVHEAYTLARGVVSVARALVTPAAPGERAPSPAVLAELRRIKDHIGPATSDVFGTTLDYSIFAASGDADTLDPALAGYSAAFTWLSAGPLLIASRADIAGAPATVTTARRHTRAAMILTRLLATNADPEARALYTQFVAARALVLGHADDVSPELLREHVARAGVELSDPRTIANVVIVDKVRHSLITGRAPTVYDGSATLHADPSDRSGRLIARSVLSMRLAGDEVTDDSAILTALTFPEVGASTAQSAPATMGEDASPLQRTLPSSLDVLSWLGSDEARTELHASGADAFARYDQTMAHLRRRFDADDLTTRHATPYASLLDALASYTQPAPADRFEPYAQGKAQRMLKLESALAFYGSLRHDTFAFTRTPLDALPSVLKNRPATAPPAAFVEAHPETIGKLLAAVKQLRRRLDAASLIPKDGTSDVLMRTAEDLLRTALAAAVVETNDAPMPLELLADLAYFPTALAEWEAWLGKTHDASLELSADLHTDLGSARVVTLATGPLEALHAIVREPDTGRLIHAVGAHWPAYELAQPATLRLSDTAWRARLAAGSAPPRFAFTGAFRELPPPAAQR